jgi:hypothetical protein
MPETNITEILNLLQDLNSAACFNIFIPSLKKEVKFKQLTAIQLKKLFKSNLNNVVIYNTKFVLLLNQIIKENCLDTEININNLTILDKFLILFKTRIESISTDYTFTLTDDEKKKYNIQQATAIYNIDQNYNNFVKQQINLEPVIIKNNNYCVTISLPTIEIENCFEEDIDKNSDKITDEVLQNILANTFINEIAKYIQTIEIDSKTIILNELDFKTRIGIIEQLPATIVNEVLKYINNYKQIINILTSCNITLENNIQIIRDININAEFFNI